MVSNPFYVYMYLLLVFRMLELADGCLHLTENPLLSPWALVRFGTRIGNTLVSCTDFSLFISNLEFLLNLQYKVTLLSFSKFETWFLSYSDIKCLSYESNSFIFYQFRININFENEAK